LVFMLTFTKQDSITICSNARRCAKCAFVDYGLVCFDGRGAVEPGSRSSTEWQSCWAVGQTGTWKLR
jgi:hypothetical protein